MLNFDHPGFKGNYQESRRYIRLGVFASLISVLAFSVTAYIIIHLNSSTLRFEIEQLTALETNWNQKFIVDLILAKSENCEKGYENVISFGHWAGVHKGCDCTKSRERSFFGSNILTESCNSTQIETGCVDVPEIPETPFRTFKKRQFCVKRSSLKFIDTPFPSGNSDCPDGYKLCGSENRDSQICIKTQEECPIYELTTLPGGHEIPPKFKLLKYTHEKELVYSRGQEATVLPVAEFTITEGQPCISRHQLPAIKNRYFYALDKRYGCEDEIFDSKEDSRFYVLDKMNQFDLYEDNGIIHQIKKIAGYEHQKLQEYENQLYWRSFISWSKQCEETPGLSRKEIIAKAHETHKLKFWEETLTLFLKLEISLPGFVLAVLVLTGLTQEFTLNDSIWHWVAGKADRLRRKAIYILCVVQTVVCVVYLHFIQSNKPSFSETKTLKCSDQFTNHTFQHMEELLVRAQISVIISIFLILGRIITDRLIIFLLVREAEAKAKQNKDKKE